MIGKSFLVLIGRNHRRYVAVERLFQKLQAVFDVLAVDGAVDPLPDSLRVSYSFFSIAETVGLTR
jgi:hypothetical protein